MKAFKIKVGEKILDYRVGKKLNLTNVREFFSKKYQVIELRSAPRHVVGVLQKNEQKLFLKLSKSEGISATTKIEYEWNDSFNNYYKNLKNFRVPRNYEFGYCENFFYIIMEYFEGPLLCPLENSSKLSALDIDNAIELSEIIQNAKIKNLKHNDFIEAKNHREFFINKTRSWLESIPLQIVNEYKLNELLKIVEEGYKGLEERPRHGDFTPWHIIRLENNVLGLIDGEHAISDGVEGYDICYFIQRIFAELKDIKTAKKIFNKLLERNYNPNKLKTILAARAIGGYLDESLKPKPDYSYKNLFHKWILEI